MPNFPRVPSARQGRGSCQSPGAFIPIIPEVLRPPLTPCSAHRHAGCTADLAGLRWMVPRGCSQHPKDTLSFLQGTLVPENTPPMELRRHGFLPTLHRADSSWTFSSCLEDKLVVLCFPTSHLATESILQACRCLVPFSPMETSFLWRALGIHTTP